MIEVKRHFPLEGHNTFGISAFAKAYCNVTSLQQLKEATQYFKQEEVFLLGGGSNMLLINDVERPVLHINLLGIHIIEENKSNIVLKVMAGENWHQLVMFCVQQNYAGIENLALIPGNTGTAPIQNIGAYGVELKDVFHSCEVFEIATGELKVLSLQDCAFGYRDSIFKNEALGKYVIVSVSLQLTNLNRPNSYQLKTEYGAIKQELEVLPGDLSIKKIAQAVINIRTSKLPDPKIIGNSGSFFKNPVVRKDLYEDLIRMHPHMPSYEVDKDHVKIPAGWLIDQSGFKGKRYGDAGIHDKQALVLVNHGKATGREILNVARTIQQEVKNRFGITIDTEVNLIEN